MPNDLGVDGDASSVWNSISAKRPSCSRRTQDAHGWSCRSKRRAVALPRHGAGGGPMYSVLICGTTEREAAPNSTSMRVCRTNRPRGGGANAYSDHGQRRAAGGAVTAARGRSVSRSPPRPGGVDGISFTVHPWGRPSRRIGNERQDPSEGGRAGASHGLESPSIAAQ